MNKPLILLGDLNIDLCHDACDLLYGTTISLFNSVHLYPMITIPTRLTDTTATCVDHIWFNSFVHSSSGVFNVNITDHFPIFLILRDNELFIDNYVDVKFRCYKKDNIQMFISEVDEYVGSFPNFACDDMHVICDSFCTELFDIFDRCFEIKSKQISVKRALTPWLTNHVLRCIDRKHQLYRNFKRGVGSYEEYRAYRNQLSKIVKAAKHN